MNVTLRQLAELVEGRLEGEAELEIRAARPIHEAGAGHITFLDNNKNLCQLQASGASAAVVGPETPSAGKSIIRVGDPFAAFLVIAEKLHGAPVAEPTGIDPRAAVDATATLGADPSIAAFAAVGAKTKIGARCRIHNGVAIGRNCAIGDDVVLHANVVLYDGTILGDRVTIHANTVVGADGYGYRFLKSRHVKVPQYGWVEIGSDVEIGACTAIARGTFSSTRIGSGTKIDNLVQVGHNCRVGAHVLLVSQVGLAGSCTIGDYTVLAGQAGVSEHVMVGAGVMVGAQSGLKTDAADGTRWFGSPARPLTQQLRVITAMEKAPDLIRDVQRLKKHLGLDVAPHQRAG